MTRTYEQLAYEQRCQISALKESGYGQRKIAVIVGTSQSTVSRELARNTGDRGYRHKQAQEKTEQRRRGVRQPTKMTPAMINIIESKLRIEWSPEQISGWLLMEREQLLSHESIYLHIWLTSTKAGTFTPIFVVRERSTTSVETANRHEVR